MLTDRDRAILDIEARWWKHAAAKEQAIRDQIDMGSTHYYLVLNRLADDPAALAYEPAVVARVRRARDRGTAGRQRLRAAS